MPVDPLTAYYLARFNAARDTVQTELEEATLLASKQARRDAIINATPLFSVSLCAALIRGVMKN